MSDTDTMEQPLADATHAIDPPIPPVDHVAEIETADPPAEMTAAERLSAFEDESFGKRLRPDDKIERGSGSRYQMASPEIRMQHAALEKLVDAEKVLADATARQMQAQADHAAAETACDAAFK